MPTLGRDSISVLYSKSWKLCSKTSAQFRGEKATHDAVWLKYKQQQRCSQMNIYSLDCWQHTELIHCVLVKFAIRLPVNTLKLPVTSAELQGFLCSLGVVWQQLENALKRKARPQVTHVFGVSYHSPLAAVSGTAIMSVGLVENLHHHHQNTLGSAKKHIQKKKDRYFSFTLHKGCPQKMFIATEGPSKI